MTQWVLILPKNASNKIYLKLNFQRKRSCVKNQNGIEVIPSFKVDLKKSSQMKMNTKIKTR